MKFLRTLLFSLAVALAAPFLGTAPQQIGLAVAPTAPAIGAALQHLGAAITPTAQATDLSNGAENCIIDWYFRGQTCTPPATWYIALYTDACSDSASGTEVSTSGTGYARVGVAATLADWAGTQGAGTTVASTGTNGTTSNNGAINFPASTAAWGTIQSVGFTDAATAGNRRICITLSSSISVAGSGYTLGFPAAALSFQVDN